MADALGCRTGTHIEDESATALFDSYFPATASEFPQTCMLAESAEEVEVSAEIIFENPDGGLQSVVRVVDGPEPPPASASPPAAPAAAPPPDPSADAPTSQGGAPAGGSGVQTVVVPYVVAHHDSFASISLRHNMTAEELMRLNGMRRQHVRPGQVVLVWAERSEVQQEEELRRTLLRQFRRVCRCPAGEALHYLESAGYDMRAALGARNDDVAWERQQAAQAAAAAAAAEAREKQAWRDEGVGGTATRGGAAPWWGQCVGALQACCGMPQPAA